jgi:hypothetical protein
VARKRAALEGVRTLDSFDSGDSALQIDSGAKPNETRNCLAKVRAARFMLKNRAQKRVREDQLTMGIGLG